ncbi:hypothetical protein Fmac_002122 [Flemingia macrophylla]|uniref:Uncharacterized protein n=1 Tax=Flemingia macrophylla TaxID=520843 RepID=A0ABD1NKD0_9FABA
MVVGCWAFHCASHEFYIQTGKVRVRKKRKCSFAVVENRFWQWLVAVMEGMIEGEYCRVR